MNYYRLYFFNASGSINHMADMECADDAAALLRAAEQTQASRAVWELWNRDRLVRRHDPSPAGVTPPAATGAGAGAA